MPTIANPTCRSLPVRPALRCARGASRWWPLVTLLLLLAFSADAAAVVNNPVAGVDLEFRGCPGAGEGCWVWWDGANKEGMGDDTIWVAFWVEDARVTLLPGASGNSYTMDVTELAVYHDGFHRMNRTWGELNESRPAGTEERVEFQSRWKRGPYEQEWGNHLYLFHRELPVQESGASICWSICQLDYNDIPYTDYDSVRVTRNGEIWSGDFHLDREVRSKHWELERCFMGRYLPPDTCFWGPWAASVWLGPQGTWLSTFPNVFISPGVQALAVHIGPNETAPPPPTVNRTLAPEGNPARSVSPAAIRLVPPLEAALPLLEQARILAGSAPGEPPPPAAALQVAAGPVAPEPIQAAVPSLVWAAAGVALALFLGFLLYTRLDRAAVLRHPLRRAILELLRQRPGLRIGEISAELRLEYNLTKYHLRKLSSAAVVDLVGSERPRAFLAGEATPQAFWAAAVSQGAGRRILDLLEGEPELELAEAIRRLGLPRSTVVDATRRLAALGLLEVEAGRRRRLRRLKLPEFRPA